MTTAAIAWLHASPSFLFYHYLIPQSSLYGLRDLQQLPVWVTRIELTGQLNAWSLDLFAKATMHLNYSLQDGIVTQLHGGTTP